MHELEEINEENIRSYCAQTKSSISSHQKPRVEKKEEKEEEKKEKKKRLGRKGLVKKNKSIQTQEEINLGICNESSSETEDLYSDSNLSLTADSKKFSSKKKKNESKSKHVMKERNTCDSCFYENSGESLQNCCCRRHDDVKGNNNMSKRTKGVKKCFSPNVCSCFNKKSDSSDDMEIHVCEVSSVGNDSSINMSMYVAGGIFEDNIKKEKLHSLLLQVSSERCNTKSFVLQELDETSNESLEKLCDACSNASINEQSSCDPESFFEENASSSNNGSVVECFSTYDNVSFSSACCQIIDCNSLSSYENLHSSDPSYASMLSLVSKNQCKSTDSIATQPIDKID